MKEAIPNLQIAAVEPASSSVLSGGQPGLHGIQGIGAGFVPDVLERSLIDQVIAIEDDEALLRATPRQGRGAPTGAVFGGKRRSSLRIAKEMRPTQRLVTLFCDTGFRYFSVEGFIQESAEKE